MPLPDEDVALSTLQDRQRKLEKQLAELRRPSLEARQAERVRKALRDLRRMVGDFGVKPVA